MLTIFGLTLSKYVWMAILGVIGYFLGALPTGYLVGKIIGKKDIRLEGSGNTGATNVFRTLGKGPGFFVLFLDIGKAFILPYYLICTLNKNVGTIDIKSEGLWDKIGEAISELMSSLDYMYDVSYVLGTVVLCILIGNCFNVFLKFKGGKGVATTYGIFLALSPLAAVASVLTYALTFFISKISGLGSLISLLLLPLYIYLINLIPQFHNDFSNFYICIAIAFYPLILWKHKKNIKELLQVRNKR